MTEKQKTRSQLERITDLFNEVGMLSKTPRSGYQFLGSGGESVAVHSHRTAVIGYVLARLAGADAARTVLICLFHDLGEARTGDLNYVNQRYDSPREADAVADAVAGTGFEAEIMRFWHEHEAGKGPHATPEGRIARDADQLDLMLNLKREQDLGNPYAARWFAAALERLMTPEARQLAETIARTDHTDWWFLGASMKWWTRREEE